MAIGVYVIRNKVNGKIYIGSATKSFNHRWGMHRLELRTNTHKNARLQNAWNKYGERAFTFKVLEECSKEKALKREQYYMDLYHSYNRMIGYNINEQARSRIGMKQQVGTGRIKHRDIHVFTLAGTKIGVYPTTSHLAHELFGNKYKASFISPCLNGNKLSYKGYVYSLKDEFPGYNPKIYVYGTRKRTSPGRGKWTQESKDKMSKTRKGKPRPEVMKKVMQFTKEGELIKVWNSGKEAAIALNTCTTNISYAAQGKRPSAAGFKWSF